MMPASDCSARFCDLTVAQLVTAGTKIGEILGGVPPQDSFLRQLASDLVGDVATVARLAADRPTGKLRSPRDGLDAERTELYMGLMRIIRAGGRHPFTAKAEAASRLSRVLDHHGLTGGTGELDLFFAGLDPSPFQIDLATLDLLSWYKNLKTVQAQYRETEREEAGAALPPLSEARRQLSSVLGLIYEGIRHQAGRDRQPYVRLAASIEEAIVGTSLSEIRHPRNPDPGRLAVPGEAALNG